MRFSMAKLSLIFIATTANAHDFWLQPKAFRYEPGIAVPFTIQVGHGGNRERWIIDNKRVLLLKSFGPGGQIDLRNKLGQFGKTADIAPVFSKTGVYVVAMQTNHAVSDLPAIRFNDYAKTEGLTPILRHRARIGKTNANGREIYSRRAKALIRVGESTGRADPRATTAIGLTLEIVPERDPYAMGKSQNLPIHVLYEGRRLAGATVKLTNLGFDSKPVAIAKTDKFGRATFRIPQTGEWLLNVVWTKPVTGRPNADFDTIFSSLTFGYSLPPKT